MGDAKGGVNYQFRKHNNFDIGCGQGQISVLVSDKPLLVLEKNILFVSLFLSYSRISLKRTPLGPRNGVRFIEVFAL